MYRRGDRSEVSGGVSASGRTLLRPSTHFIVENSHIPINRLFCTFSSIQGSTFKSELYRQISENMWFYKGKHTVSKSDFSALSGQRSGLNQYQKVQIHVRFLQKPNGTLVIRKTSKNEQNRK